MLMPYYLIGMILGSHAGQYAEEFPDEDGGITTPKDVSFNAGISIAMATSDILDFLENDKTLKRIRAECLEEPPKKSSSLES